ncbi:MATE family efflux transporter [Bacteroidota bacterium]
MKDLTTGSEGKLIFKFALPMLLGNVFQQVYNVVDSIIVGNALGKEALSAVGASFPILFVLISLVIGIAMGGGIIISQYFGAKDYDKVKKAIGTMYIFLFLVSFVITAIGLIFSESIFRLIQLPEEIIPQANEYLTIILAGIITMFGFNGTSGILRGLGDSKTPLYFLILSTILNIILDLLFVIVFKWGISGVAWATVISQGIAFLTATIYLNKTHKLISIRLKTIRLNLEIFKKMITVGLPSGFQQMMAAMGMMALFRIVNAFGTNTIAAYSVAGRIDSFAIMPAMNFSAALTSFIGQNIGAGKLYRVKRGYISTLIMTLVISSFFTIVMVFFGRPLMSIFTPDLEVINIGVEYLIIVSSFYLIFTALFITLSVFRGAGDTLAPMIITLIALWLIRIPISYFLSEKIGTNGIWWGIPISWGSGLLIAVVYYFTGIWKNKAVVKAPIPKK